MSGALRVRHLVGQGIVDHRLWAPGERVVVAVSGGLDSVCLLDLLVALRGWHGGELEVASADHRQRPEAAQELAFAGELAASHGLPFHALTLPLDPGASAAACRDARYAALEALGADAIATAHHRDDQVETVLANLARGTGLRGLAGMRPRRGRVVRPLLAIGRAALQAWAEARGLSWVEDPSNRSPRYLRNRIRAQVVPAIEAARPGAVPAIARTAERLAADAALLDELARAAGVAEPGPAWRLAWILETPEPLVARVLRAWAPVLGWAHIDALLDLARRGGGEVELAHGWRGEVVGGRLWLIRRAAATTADAAMLTFPGVAQRPTGVNGDGAWAASPSHAAGSTGTPSAPLDEEPE